MNYTDWFLPSSDELQLMNSQLYMHGVGGFSASGYWSSSEQINAPYLNAYEIDFSINTILAQPKGNSYRVRGCHTFIAETGSFAIRDKGICNGYIFWIVSLGGGMSKFYEAAPSDVSASHVWSNITIGGDFTYQGIGYGYSNSLAIVNQYGHTTSAALSCLSEIIAGYEAPTALYLTSVGCSTVVLNWTNNNSSGILNNIVEKFTGGVWNDYTIVGSGVTNSTVVIPPTTTMPLRVKVSLTSGGAIPSASISATTITVTNPTSLVLTHENYYDTRLNWINHSSGGTISIWRVHGVTGTMIASGLAYTLTTFLDTGTTHGYTYSYQVVATCGVYGYYSNSAYITIPSNAWANLNYSNVSCYAASNAMINMFNPSGGTGSYQYTINGGANWYASGYFSGLSPSTYDVRIRDSGYTSNEYTLNGALVLTQPAILNAGNSSMSIMCHGATSFVNFNSQSGGSGVYEYSSDSGNTWQSSPNFSPIYADTHYQFWIRDANCPSCSLMMWDVYKPDKPELYAQTIHTNVSIYGGTDGSITFQNASGGGGTFKYSIDNAHTWQTSPNFTGLSAGTYTCLVQDAGFPSCYVFVVIINITEPAPAPVNPSDFCNGTNYVVHNATCGNANGYITVYPYDTWYDFTLTDVDGNAHTLGGGLTADYYFITATVKPAFWSILGRNSCQFDWIRVTDTNTSMHNTGVSVRDVVCGGFGRQQGRIAIFNTDSGSNGSYTGKIYNERRELVQTITGNTILQMIFAPLSADKYYIVITNNNNDCVLLLGLYQIKAETLRSVSGIKKLWLTEWSDSIEYNYWSQSDEDYYLSGVDNDFFNSIKIDSFIDSTLVGFWYSINLMTKSITFQQVMNKTHQGFIFGDKLTLGIPQIENVKWKELVDLLTKRYILVFLDNNGYYWCTGYRHGAQVSGYKVSNNEYALEFYADSENKILTSLASDYVTNSIL